MPEIVKDDKLPEIPAKRYFTISEVSELCLVKAHVLRYWEQEFKQLTPNKRKGNRRYYQQQDVLLIRKIRRLLYQHGFTIEGARQKINDDTKKLSRGSTHSPVSKLITELEVILGELKL